MKIMQLVTRCTQLLNVQHNMNAMQIEFCAENIMENMWMYSLEDVQLCLDRGAVGAYGTIYNRIDPATILAWFPMYDAQRQMAVETINQEEQKQNNIYEMFQHPQVMQAMSDVYDKMPHKESPAPEPNRPMNALEQQLLKEYDALPEWSESRWFRVYNNKPYQFSEYRMERYKELIENQNEY